VLRIRTVVERGFLLGLFRDVVLRRRWRGVAAAAEES
jgi:hypothetical protein